MATATVAISSPRVNHKFAIRTHIKVLAVKCQCGAVYAGRGVRKMKTCGRCGGFVITAHEQRSRESWHYGDVDQEIFDRYQAKAGAA